MSLLRGRVIDVHAINKATAKSTQLSTALGLAFNAVLMHQPNSGMTTTPAVDI